MRLPPIASALALLVTASGAAAPSRLDTLSLGETRTGRLEPGDLTLPSGEYMDRWGFVGREGETLTIDLISSDFDPYLILQRPDGTQFDNDDRAPGDLNARASQRLTLDGRYSIVVTTYSPGETGAYTLTVTPGLAPPPPDPDAVAEAAPPIPVALGFQAQGTLAPGDTRLHSGRFVDEYVFEGQAGHQVMIDMRSTALDCHLTLIHPRGEQTINDDLAPGRLDSHIELTLPDSGTYRLRASSYRAGETGAYGIAILDVTRPLAVGLPITGSIGEGQAAAIHLLDPLPGPGSTLRVHLRGPESGPDLDLEVLCRAAPAALSPWQSIALSRGLGAEEEVVIGTQHRPPYLVRVVAPAGAAGPFELQALPGPAAEFLVPGQRVEGFLDARQRTRLWATTAPAAGLFIATLEAKGGEASVAISGRPAMADLALAPVQLGERVSITVAAAVDGPSLPQPIEFRLRTALAQQGAPLASGSPVQGWLQRAGGFATLHPIASAQGGLIQVSLAGPAPGLALCLVDLDAGEVLARVDAVERTHVTAMAAPPPGVACAALVLAADTAEAPQGYTLVQDFGAASPPFLLTASSTPARLTTPAGQTAMFQVPQAGFHRLRVVPEGRGGPLGLDLLTTSSPAGRPRQTIAARPELVFHATPDARQWVRVFDPSGAGGRGFTLETAAVSDTPLAAGDPATPEMWGVFAGISDYGEARDNLPFCADDAVNLRRVFEQRGFIVRDHTVLLTDGQATRAAIQAALETIAARAGPEDTLVFFFSGHGGQTDRREESAELDAMEEYICPADTDLPGADIVDDDLARWLDAVPAGKVLVFLDSCNSGGFRDELATRRGRVCLFASEEDLESFTYEESKAGGILAHVLAEGFAGAADLNGDGRLSAGEICDHALTEMPAIRISDAAHSSRLAQHPEWVRTVPYDTVLVTLN